MVDFGQDTVNAQGVVTTPKTIIGTGALNVTLDDGTVGGAATSTIALINNVINATTGIVTATVTNNANDNEDNDIDAILGARMGI